MNKKLNRLVAGESIRSILLESALDIIPFRELKKLLTDNYDCVVISSEYEWVQKCYVTFESTDDITAADVNSLIEKAGYTTHLTTLHSRAGVYKFARTGYMYEKASLIKEDDEEYWNYVHDYDYGVPGHEEEVEKAADFFDVSPSAFEETYADFYELEDRASDWDEWNEMDESKLNEVDLSPEETKEALAALDKMCGRLKAEDIYNNAPKFQVLVQKLKNSFDQVGGSLIKVSFVNSAGDAHALAVSLDTVDSIFTITVWEGAGGKQIKRFPFRKWKSACEYFHDTLLEKEQFCTDKKELFMQVSYNIYFQYRRSHFFNYKMENPSYGKTIEKPKDLDAELKKLATDDYQNRGGDYPESDVPDSIDVFHRVVTASFKNTSEGDAIHWLEDYLSDNGFVTGKPRAMQTGDYHDDWVDASVEVTGFKESKVLESLMGNEDVIGNIKLALKTKDHDLMKSVLADLNDGDMITLDTKTYKGSIYKLVVTKKNDVTFIVTQVVKGKQYSPEKSYIGDAAEDLIYFPTMTGGSFPNINLRRAN